VAENRPHTETIVATFSKIALKLLGSGSSLPGQAINNQVLVKFLAELTSSRYAKIAAKIASRLGIVSRHVSRDLSLARSGSRSGFHSHELCSKAILNACDMAGLDREKLGYLIGHTTTPYSLLPANIAWVAQELQFQGPYMELRQACTGFASALHIAAGVIGTETCDRVSIVGSENGSSYFAIEEGFLTKEQLVNFVQMGDGAGAVVLGPDDGTGHGIISNMYSGQLDYSMRPGFSLHGGGSANPNCASGLPQFVHDASAVLKNGPELFRAGVQAIKSRGYSLTDFDWIIPHQANGKLAHAFKEAYGIDTQRIYVTADRLGNMGSAAIWVSLDRLIRSGRLETGHCVLVLGAEASKYLYGGFIYNH